MKKCLIFLFLSVGGMAHAQLSYKDSVMHEIELRLAPDSTRITSRDVLEAFEMTIQYADSVSKPHPIQNVNFVEWSWRFADEHPFVFFILALEVFCLFFKVLESSPKIK